MGGVTFTQQIIVVVCAGTSLMAGAAVKALRRLGYVVHFINPSAAELVSTRKDVSLYLVFVNATLAADRAALERLKDTAGGMQVRMVLAGRDSDLSAVREVLPAPLIAAALPLPLHLSELLQAVGELVPPMVKKDRRRILLVDDDQTFLHTVYSWLKDSYDVAPVNSGTHALQYLGSHTPDLILLDYEMPGLDGPQVLECIRHEDALRDLPVFFLTGVDSADQVKRAIRLKPEGYLLKGMSREDLLGAIARFFAAGTEGRR